MPQPFFITAPSIPGTGKSLFCNKFTCHIAEVLPCLEIAISLHLQGTGVIQTQHTNEALAVDLLGFVAHPNGKGLHRRQRDKVLYLLERTQGNVKFLHLRALLLYKSKSLLYNDNKEYNRNLIWFQFANLEDIIKILHQKLVEMTT